MQMNGEYTIPAPRQKVWEALNDPEVLKACIPGCEELDKTGDHAFAAKVKAKVGPVSAKFNGEVTLSDMNPPESYTISGEGKGGAAGFAKGGAKVHLTEEGPETTRLAYDVEAKVGGKLAQVGSRLIDGTAKKMADQFFTAFVERVGGSGGGGGGSGGEPTPENSGESGSIEPEEHPGAGNEPANPNPRERQEMQEAALRGAALGHASPESDGGAAIKAEASHAATQAADSSRQRRSYGPVSWVFMVIAVVAILLFVFEVV
ncbi:MAG: carbon monoxide dehydrogenase subunit G [Rhodovibrionaceae bacterium]